MIDPFSFLVFTLLAVGLSHVATTTDQWNRLFWVVAPGLALLFMTHPLALAFAIACFMLSTGVFLVGRTLASPRVGTRLPYAILLVLFVPDLAAVSNDAPILWLGAAFFIVRQMMTVAQGIKKAVGIRDFVPGLLMATFFFAALPSGPVFNGLQIWEQLKRKASPASRDGAYRLFEGFVYLFAIAGFADMAFGWVDETAGRLAGPVALAPFLLLHLVAKPVIAFSVLFATFYGYSRMAEGTALLLGFEVPQNFHQPHLARDLGDFWKRWHRSMADFVMQYIYLPVLVTTARARLALVAAFVFMGLWHKLSAGFLIWGLGHGLGLAYLLPWAQRRRAGSLTLRLASLAYVILLSSIAHEVWHR